MNKSTPQRFSISLRLTFWFGVIFFVGWVLFGLAMAFNLHRTLTHERRQTLTRRIDRLEDLLRKNQGQPEADRIQDLRDFAHATGNGLVEVIHPDGATSLPLPSEAAQAFAWPTSLSDIKEDTLRHVDSGGQPYWIIARPVDIAGQQLLLLAAAPESGNLLVLSSFWTGLLASVPVLLLISSAGGYWISRRALGPVDRITAKARSISIRNLSERLPVEHTGDELERLAETCNDMLSRLESAVNRIKQFTADASHELRGPLSFTRTVSEVALRNPHIDPLSRQSFEDIVDEVARATVLLENMLALARADAHSSAAGASSGDHSLTQPFAQPFEPIDLTDIIAEACSLARPVAENRGLEFIVRVNREPVDVLGDFASLRRLLWIVLDNALKYTNSPGRIELELTTHSGEAVIDVRDTGIGIAASDLPRIFDRFYRADPSRSQVEGSGLGLAIAQWIAELHHARLSVTSQENAGTTFRIAIPLLNTRTSAKASAHRETATTQLV